MKDTKLLVLIVAAFAVILVAAGLLYRSLTPEMSSSLAAQSTPVPTEAVSARPDADASDAPTDEQSVAAPDFTMLNSDGESVSLSEHFGKPIVLNFWASWCGPCKNEMPAFDALSAELGEDIEFMMINLTDGRRETIDTATQFISEQGYSFPVFFDTDYEGASAYAVRSIPVTYFIDADGVIKAYAAGGVDDATLRQGISMITE